MALTVTPAGTATPVIPSLAVLREAFGYIAEDTSSDPELSRLASAGRLWAEEYLGQAATVPEEILAEAVLRWIGLAFARKRDGRFPRHSELAGAGVYELLSPYRRPRVGRAGQSDV